MGSYVSAAEPPPVTRQPTEAQTWLYEAADQLAKQKLREDTQKLSTLLMQGCFKRKGLF